MGTSDIKTPPFVVERNMILNPNSHQISTKPLAARKKHPMNPRLEPFLIAIVVWLCIAVVLAYALAGCAVPQ